AVRHGCARVTDQCFGGRAVAPAEKPEALAPARRRGDEEGFELPPNAVGERARRTTRGDGLGDDAVVALAATGLGVLLDLQNAEGTAAHDAPGMRGGIR